MVRSGKDELVGRTEPDREQASQVIQGKKAIPPQAIRQPSGSNQEF